MLRYTVSLIFFVEGQYVDVSRSLDLVLWLKNLSSANILSWVNPERRLVNKMLCANPDTTRHHKYFCASITARVLPLKLYLGLSYCGWFPFFCVWDLYLPALFNPVTQFMTIAVIFKLNLDYSILNLIWSALGEDLQTLIKYLKNGDNVISILIMNIESGIVSHGIFSRWARSSRRVICVVMCPALSSS